MNTVLRVVLFLFFFALRLAFTIVYVVKTRRKHQKALLATAILSPVLLYAVSVFVWSLLPRSLFFSPDLGLYALLGFELLHCHLLLFSFVMLNFLERKHQLTLFPLVFVALLLVSVQVPVLLILWIRFSDPTDWDILNYVLLFLNVLLFFVLLYLFLSSFLTEAMLQESLSDSKRKADERRYQEINEMYERTRKLNHEIRNHMAVVEQMIQEGRIEEGASYLKQIRDDFHPVIHTGCAPLDALIALKDAEIRKCGFEFQYELSPLSHLNVLDHELCSLAGNLLDNAIEACVSEKIPDTVIQFKILHIRDMLFLQCSNPTAKNPSVISRDRIATTKDPNVHGFGIPIMESIARKYGGIYDMKIENGQFKVLISIPLLPV